MNPNPRIPYRFSGQGVDLKPHAKGRILVHLVVNVEHWVFDAAMPRTLITPAAWQRNDSRCAKFLVGRVRHALWLASHLKSHYRAGINGINQHQRECHRRLPAGGRGHAPSWLGVHRPWDAPENP